MSEHKPQREGDIDPSRYVYYERPKCPRCASTNLLTYKSTRHGDAAVSRYTACRSCGEKFILVLE